MSGNGEGLSGFILNNRVYGLLNDNKGTIQPYKVIDDVHDCLNTDGLNKISEDQYHSIVLITQKNGDLWRWYSDPYDVEDIEFLNGINPQKITDNVLQVKTDVLRNAYIIKKDRSLWLWDIDSQVINAENQNMYELSKGVKEVITSSLSFPTFFIKDDNSLWYVNMFREPWGSTGKFKKNLLSVPVKTIKVADNVRHCKTGNYGDYLFYVFFTDLDNKLWHWMIDSSKAKRIKQNEVKTRELQFVADNVIDFSWRSNLNGGDSTDVNLIKADGSLSLLKVNFNTLYRPRNWIGFNNEGGYKNIVKIDTPFKVKRVCTYIDTNEEFKGWKKGLVISEQDELWKIENGRVTLLYDNILDVSDPTGYTSSIYGGNVFDKGVVLKRDGNLHCINTGRKLLDKVLFLYGNSIAIREDGVYLLYKDDELLDIPELFALL